MGSNSTEKKGDNSSDNKCIEMLNLVLDEEATEEERAFFMDHMEKCMPCYENYQVDMVIKKLIKENCCGQKVPQQMIDDIRSKVFHKTD